MQVKSVIVPIATTKALSEDWGATGESRIGRLSNEVQGVGYLALGTNTYPKLECDASVGVGERAS